MYRLNEILYKFEDNNKITSIEIKHQNWGMMMADEISKYSLKISEKGVDIKYYSSVINLLVQSYEYSGSKEKTKEILEKLITDVKVLEWEEDYSEPACDGFHYDIIIVLSNGLIKKNARNSYII